MNLATQLREAFWTLKRKRIRASPVHTTRASSLGHHCERFLVYERTQSELRTLHQPDLQAIFDLGHNVEKYVIHELEEMGCEVVQRGRDYEDKRYDMTGHVDAKLWMKDWPKPIPFEIKGLNPFTAESIATIEDIRDSRQIWVRKYYAQLQAYLFLDNSELGVFALLNKSSGKIDFIECPLDYEYAEALLKKAERIRDHVKAGTLPERVLSAECARCPFAHVCLPDMQYGQGIEFFDSAEVEGMLARRAELESAAREFDALDKAIKKQLPHKPEVLIGQWAVTGKEIERKGYEVKPGSYWKFEFLKLTNGGNNAGER